MDLREALDELLPGGQTGELRTDLVAAARETWRRRRRNSEVGGTVLAALQDPTIMGEGKALSAREIERQIGIPRSTVGRWSLPPGTD